MSRCLVIGNGAIGTTIASRLRILDFSCRFVGRRGPLYITNRFEGWGQVTYLKVHSLSEEDLSRIRIAFVTVRAYDLGGALARYLPYLPKNIPIIPFCHGSVDHIISSAARKFPDFIWRSGLCSFDSIRVSEDIFKLRSEKGFALWGPSHHGAESGISPAEQDILNADQQVFFRWDSSATTAIRRKWAFDTVIHSLSASSGFEQNGLLLSDMKKLRETFAEVYRLGIELWGNWNESEDKLFEDLICRISAVAAEESSMVRDIRMNRRTENHYLAGRSLGRHHYKILNALAVEIHRKSESAISRNRRK
ncbi:MAG: hypothetical protein H6618_06945 [Deltaproteobacteria bacterium]|nr:hypothetical protein [Deltaproteobacteria bacterium]